MILCGSEVAPFGKKTRDAVFIRHKELPQI